jgi:hypothetical protein
MLQLCGMHAAKPPPHILRLATEFVSVSTVVLQARRDKARDLLQRGWQPHMSTPKYDPEQALVLCRQHSYRPGLVLLYEKKRLYREVLQVRFAQEGLCTQHFVG